jgi:hypothetical protein
METPCAFPVPSQEMRFPHWYRSQVAGIFHRFQICDYFPKPVHTGSRQPFWIVILIQTPQAFVHKVSNLHFASVACSFTLVNAENQVIPVICRHDVAFRSHLVPIK